MKKNNRGSLVFGIIMLLIFIVTIYVLKMQMDRIGMASRTMRL